MFSFDLEENEQLVKMYRQTESVLFLPVVFLLLGIYVPIWFLLKYELFGQFVWLLVLWTVLLLVYGLHKYLLWLITVYLVTDKRVVSVVYNSILRRVVREAELSDVKNILSESKGLTSVLFGFDDLLLEASEGATLMVFKNVRKPEEVKTLVRNTKLGASKTETFKVKTRKIV